MGIVPGDDHVSSAEYLGNRTQKWYLHYIASGVYEIVNAQTGYVLTNEGGLAVTAPDTDGANQRWQITAVSQNFEGNDLYYKIVSNADSTAAPPSIPRAIPSRWTAIQALSIRTTS